MGDHARIALRPRGMAICSGRRRPAWGEADGEVGVVGAVGWARRPRRRGADTILFPPLPTRSVGAIAEQPAKLDTVGKCTRGRCTAPSAVPGAFAPPTIGPPFTTGLKPSGPQAGTSLGRPGRWSCGFR